MNIGSGPGLYTVTEDTKGNSTGEAKELPPQQREDRTVPPTPQPRSRKTQTTESTVGWTSPQEVHHQADLVPSGEGLGTVASADPGDIGPWREPLEPTPYGPPRTEDVRPQCLDFSANTPIYPAPCQICGSPDHQTNYCQGGRRRELEDPSSPSSGEEEASKRRCPNCTNEHPGECPCGWCNQLRHISSQCTARHDSDVIRQRFPKRVRKKKPTVSRYQCWKCAQYHSFKEYCPNVPYPQPCLGNCKACKCIDGRHAEGCDYDTIRRRLLLCTYCRKAGHIHQDCRQ